MAKITHEMLTAIGLTVPQLAAICGVHRSVAYRYLSGEAEPPGAVLALLQTWPTASEAIKAGLLAGRHLGR